jgi:hypothetical protein
MKYIALIIALSLASPAYSASPSETSVRDLMRVMESQKMLDVAFGQLDSIMQSTMKQALQGKDLTPEIQTAMDHARTKMIATMKEEMSWPKLEPVFIDLYKKSFTQTEIDGMLAFYSSEVGRAVIAKMPLVMQNSTQLLQQTLVGLMPRMRTIQNEMVAEINAITCKDKCNEGK